MWGPSLGPQNTGDFLLYILAQKFPETIVLITKKRPDNKIKIMLDQTDYQQFSTEDDSSSWLYTTKYGYGRNCQNAVLVQGDTGTRADTPGYTYPAVSHLFQIKKGERNRIHQIRCGHDGDSWSSSQPQPRLEAAAAWTRLSWSPARRRCFPQAQLFPRRRTSIQQRGR